MQQNFIPFCDYFLCTCNQPTPTIMYLNRNDRFVRYPEPNTNGTWHPTTPEIHTSTGNPSKHCLPSPLSPLGHTSNIAGATSGSATALGLGSWGTCAIWAEEVAYGLVWASGSGERWPDLGAAWGLRRGERVPKTVLRRIFYTMGSGLKSRQASNKQHEALRNPMKEKPFWS